MGFVVPGLIAHIIWWTYAGTHPSTFDLFTDVTADTPNWYMCVTMAFGSMVAGATSEVRKACPENELLYRVSARIRERLAFAEAGVLRSSGMLCIPLAAV